MRWDAFHLELAYSNVLTGDGHHVLDRVLWRNVLYIGSDPPLSPARALGTRPATLAARDR